MPIKITICNFLLYVLIQIIYWFKNLTLTNYFVSILVIKTNYFVIKTLIILICSKSQITKQVLVLLCSKLNKAETKFKINNCECHSNSGVNRSMEYAGMSRRTCKSTINPN